MRWHCSSDTGFEVRAPTVWGRARYLSVTDVPHTINIFEWAGKKHFVSLKLGGQSGAQTRDLQLSKQAALMTARGPPPYTNEQVQYATGVIFYETQWRHSVKTRLYNTPPPYFILWNDVTSLGEKEVI